MSILRRDFIKLLTGSVAGLGISQIFHPGIVKALAGTLDGSRPPVIWLNGQSCGGCTLSMLNAVHPSIAQILQKQMNLEYHPDFMLPEGSSALRNMFEVADRNSGKFFLLVEGSIPLAHGGAFCRMGSMNGKEYNMADVLRELAPRASAVVSVGSCASFGGIPAAGGNLTDSVSAGVFLVQQDIKTPLVNLPGCAPHPDWIIGTLAMMLELVNKAGLSMGIYEVMKTLDQHGRPQLYYGKNIHENCPYRPSFGTEAMAADFSDKTGCRARLGCKGPSSMADCFERKWNGAVNWCVDNAVCTGCVEPDFPDGKSPFYEPEPTAETPA